MNLLLSAFRGEAEGLFGSIEHDGDAGARAAGGVADAKYL